jgi:uncharacterized membrane protein (UPF0136 family)
MLNQIVLGAYGVFMMVGGYLGFKKGSTVSLAMGLGSGLLIFIGLWLLSVNPKGAWTFLSCLTGVLALTFVIRLVKTGAFMPSGMLLIITAAVFVFCLVHLK